MRVIRTIRCWRTASSARRRLGTAFVASCIALLAVSTQPALLAQHVKQSKTEQSCRNFVQQFYTWYLGRNALIDKSRSAGPSWDDVLKLRPEVLSPGLLSLLKDDLAASRANSEEVVGLDWDPFLATQDPSAKFEVDSVSMKNSHCYAVVNGIEHGKKQETVVPELTAASDTWVFVNFHYNDQPPQDENLIATLKQLRDQRKKSRN
jgi:hypothetical protein